MRDTEGRGDRCCRSRRQAAADTLIEYLPDPDAGMTLSQVQALPASHWQLHLRGIPNFGFTSSAYWFRFRLYNHSPQPLERLLEIDYPILTASRYIRSAPGICSSSGYWGDKPRSSSGFSVTAISWCRSACQPKAAVKSGFGCVPPVRCRYR